jgi:hypothetical protein
MLAADLRSSDADRLRGDREILYRVELNPHRSEMSLIVRRGVDRGVRVADRKHVDSLRFLGHDQPYCGCVPGVPRPAMIAETV